MITYLKYHKNFTAICVVPSSGVLGSTLDLTRSEQERGLKVFLKVVYQITTANAARKLQEAFVFGLGLKGGRLIVLDNSTLLGMGFLITVGLAKAVDFQVGDLLTLKWVDC